MNATGVAQVSISDALRVGCTSYTSRVRPVSSSCIMPCLISCVLSQRASNSCTRPARRCVIRSPLHLASHRVFDRGHPLVFYYQILDGLFSERGIRFNDCLIQRLLRLGQVVFALFVGIVTTHVVIEQIKFGKEPVPIFHAMGPLAGAKVRLGDAFHLLVARRAVFPRNSS